jgi:branched-chain amino acid transport system substrate-binding protein
VDKADYVLSAPNANALTYQDICCGQKKILLTMGTSLEDLTQRVADNYDKYKYYFRAEWNANSTAMDVAHVQGLASLKNATGFTKIGYLLYDMTAVRENLIPYLEDQLPKLGFQIVYRSIFSTSTTDFTSYFAQAEAANTQILFTLLPSIPKSVPLVNEWCDRQSPMVLCGSIYGVPDPTFWNTTSGKTNYVLSLASAVILGYPLTDKTIPVRDAFQARWGVSMKAGAAAAYDIVKYLLTDAINRAGTTETEAVIKTLETVNVDTVLAKGFEFTHNHDIFIDSAGMTSTSQSNMLLIIAQWQNGAEVPVFPETLKTSAGATYKFPPWPGPWNK